ncbi:MAG: MFS transporter [Nocardioidaceae bacterium]|nr:MFS transporter [Nocardioidaceae bacterium]
MAPPATYLARDSRRGRLTLLALTLGSGIVILDGTVVNVALRTIGVELGASLGQLQWVVNGYLLALASLVLLGGALGDRLGRRRVYVAGMGLFMLGSVACALAPTIEVLIVTRVGQGVGGALLMPGALAIIQASYAPVDRGPAIGTWAGMAGVGAAIGPFVGGWLVDHGGWRWVFGINVPFCLVVLAIALVVVPESRDAESSGRFDLGGAALTVIALGALTWALIAAPESPPWAVAGAVVVAVVAGTAFLLLERRLPRPMVPLGLFGSRVFAAANAMTFLVYGALGAVLFMLVLQLQVSAGWSALAAGLVGLPVTIAMMLLSSRTAGLSQRIGPRLPMSLGPLICAAGVTALLAVGRDATWLAVLPGIVVFALGLSLLVSPLTATVLAEAPDRFAGIASGINNAVARAGSLLAVAALPAIAGLSGAAYRDPAAMTSGYRTAMVLCAVLLLAGGAVSWVGLRATEPGSRSPQASQVEDG